MKRKCLDEAASGLKDTITSGRLNDYSRTIALAPERQAKHDNSIVAVTGQEGRDVNESQGVETLESFAIEKTTG